jgi:type VI secretion system protein ImpB
MADSFQNEVPKARINLKLDLHTGGASKKMELPLKLLVAGDFSNGQDLRQYLSVKRLTSPKIISTAFFPNIPQKLIWP